MHVNVHICKQHVCFPYFLLIFSIGILYRDFKEHSSIFLIFYFLKLDFIQNSYGNWSLNTPHFCISVYFPMEKLRNPEVRVGMKNTNFLRGCLVLA